MVNKLVYRWVEEHPENQGKRFVVFLWKWNLKKKCFTVEQLSSEYFKITACENGKTVALDDVKLEKIEKKISKILHKGKVIWSIPDAPYQFVSLPTKIIPALENSDNAKAPLSGYLILNITPESPLQISTPKDRPKKGLEDKKDPKDLIFWSPHQEDSAVIPGSSLRGMFTTLMQIYGFAKMQPVLNQNLYYRAVFDKSSLGRHYTDQMASSTSYPGQHIRAGHLKKNRNRFVIVPAETLNSGTTFTRVNFSDRKIAGQNSEFSEFSFQLIKFDGSDIQNKSIVKKNKQGHIIIDLPYTVLKQVKEFSLDDDQLFKGVLVNSGLIEKKHMQWVVYPPLASQNNKGINLDVEIVLDYQSDVNRTDDVDLLGWLDLAARFQGFMEKSKDQDGNIRPNYSETFETKNEKEKNWLKWIKDYVENWPQEWGQLAVPCFYLMDKSESKVLSFGHTGFMRLRYQNSPKQGLPENHQKNVAHLKDMDVVESMLGLKSVDGIGHNRLFFEDAVLSGEAKFGDESYIKPLAQPKPTAFQMYLDQDEIENPLNYKHYDSDAFRLRGYKLYWHQGKQPKWQGKPKSNGQYLPIQPKLKPLEPCEANTFTARIRFQDLLSEELGLLLWAAQLHPDNNFTISESPKSPRYRHKIGMGKPYGLGSIKLTAKLELLNPDRYTDLELKPIQPQAADAQVASGEPDKETIKYYMYKWAEYALKKLANGETHNPDSQNKIASFSNESQVFQEYLNHQHIQDLLTLMCWEETPPLEHQQKVLYQKLDDFKARRRLPKRPERPNPEK